MGDRVYDNSTFKKVNLLKEKGVKLIAIYPNDMNKLDEELGF